MAASATTASATAAGAADKPVRKVKLGFIALTDAAPIIMAKELGLFEQYRLDVTVSKQASWPALRDALQNGQIDGAHCLFGMPFSVARPKAAQTIGVEAYVDATPDEIGSRLVGKYDLGGAWEQRISPVGRCSSSGTATCPSPGGVMACGSSASTYGWAC